MALITRTYGSGTANPVATGSTILAAHVNTDLDTIYADYNGGITNANVASAAAIAISKTTLAVYTDWAAWTPTCTGFSSTPSTTCKWTQIGKTVFAKAIISGTSNATGFTFTLPTTSNQNGWAGGNANLTDNGSALSPFGGISITAASNVATVYVSGTSASFTATGTKGVTVNFFYETA